MTRGWPGRRKVVVFQPHRYSRTQALFDDFARSFHQADVLLVMSIYAASEDPIQGVDSRKLCHSIQTRGHKDVRFVDDLEGALAGLFRLAAAGDVVLTLGAGNVYQVGEAFLERFDA